MFDTLSDRLQEIIKKTSGNAELTEENKKEVKTGIAEINKVKERISRYRIDETNRFLEYIQPYVDKCKELEKLCDTGLAGIKQKVKDLENAEKALKKETVSKAFELFMATKDYSNFLKFEMFFDEKMCNKSVSLNAVADTIIDMILNSIECNLDSSATVDTTSEVQTNENGEIFW